MLSDLSSVLAAEPLSSVVISSNALSTRASTASYPALGSTFFFTSPRSQVVESRLATTEVFHPEPLACLDIEEEELEYMFGPWALL